MSKNVNRLTIAVFCILSLVFASSARPSAMQKTATSDDVRWLDGAAAAAAFNAEDSEAQALARSLSDRGYQAGTAVDDYVGWVMPFVDPEGRAVSAILIVRNFNKPGSRDAAGLLQVNLVSTEISEWHTLSIEALNGDFSRTIERRVDDKGQIDFMPQSTFSCFRDSLVSRCGPTAIKAIVLCVPAASTLAGYLACVGLQIGACATQTYFCCLCNCGWLCKRLVGCCHR